MATCKTLHTIGYEGADIRDFVATLKASGIDKLLDVRDVTTSRRPGFSKNQLAAALASEGIDYAHLKGLGDPKPGRLAARAGDIPGFRRIYAAHLATDVAQADLLAASREAVSGKACLMCYEREPTDCHRSIVADKISIGTGVAVSHLGVRDGIHRARQTARKGPRPGQSAAARWAETR
jgi:uncharacterized protein (DUF488 family)